MSGKLLREIFKKHLTLSLFIRNFIDKKRGYHESKRSFTITSIIRTNVFSASYGVHHGCHSIS